MVVYQVIHEYHNHLILPGSILKILYNGIAAGHMDIETGLAYIITTSTARHNVGFRFSHLEYIKVNPNIVPQNNGCNSL